MDIYIGAGEITGRSEYAVRLRVTDKPGMTAGIDSPPTDSEARLERHIEAGDAWAISRDFHS